jgi:hypothetical protein
MLLGTTIEVLPIYFKGYVKGSHQSGKALLAKLYASSRDPCQLVSFLHRQVLFLELEREKEAFMNALVIKH